MDSIERDSSDICGFADPFTEFRSTPGPKGVKIELIRNGRPVRLDLKNDGAVSEVGGRSASFSSVNSLLASDRFANLAQLSATQILYAKSRQVKSRIPTCVKVGKQDLGTEELAGIIGGVEKRLKLLLLDGPAGVGKSFQIEQLVVAQAKRLQRGDLAAPILHVSSKGRRLSNLRDVLAAATQEMNASFFAKHVPMLVRRGLLVVAIDGFDELVDADGYEDSWLALRSFVEDVGSGGAMVLAARDTFVEEQELLERINRSRNDVELISGQVRSPNSEQALAWLGTSPSWKPAELQSDDALDLLRDGSYALRPFFLRELWGVKAWSEVVDAGPRTFIVNRLMAREARLIAQQLGGTTAEKLTPALLHFMQEVALEMAGRETDRVEVEHLGFLTQFCFDGLVDEQAIRKLMHKSGSLALLELTGDKGYRSFPHSEMMHYFLGMSILNSLSSGGMPGLLRRHALNCSELDVFSEVFINSPTEGALAARNTASLLSSEISNDELAPNLSSLAVLMFSLGYLDRVDYAECVEATFAGGVPQGVMAQTKIGRLDATGSNISEVKFENVIVGTLVVDDSTIMGDSQPEISSLEVLSVSGNVMLRGQKDISEWCARRVRSSDVGDSLPVLLLERISRVSIRQFYLRLTGDEDVGSALLSDPWWPVVSRVLSKYNRLEVHRAKPMHGRPSPLVRVKNPMSLLDRTDKVTKKIVEELTASSLDS